MKAIGLAPLALIVVGILNAQSPPPAAIPKFEVASIRQCEGSAAGGRSGGTSRSSPGRLIIECQTLGTPFRTFPGLIPQAYGLFVNGRRNPLWAIPPVEGGPAWIDSERYTIEAKAEGTPSLDVMMGPMLQALLEDRFSLKIHRESKEVPVYALTVAKGGPKIKVFTEGCIPIAAVNPPAPLAPGLHFCKGGARIAGPNFVMDVEAATLDEFSKNLGLGLDRPVINKTGIAGKFDFHLEYAVDESTVIGHSAGDPSDPARGVSIFTAVQEQLGLKLESAKGPREALVIDHVERPSGN